MSTLFIQTNFLGAENYCFKGVKESFKKWRDELLM